MNSVAGVSNGILLIHHRGWFKPLLFYLLAAIFTPGQLSATETASYQINHISLDEAKELVRTQLSPVGQLSILPSRSMIIVVDERRNIGEIRQMLHRFDVPVPKVLLSLQIQAVPEAPAKRWVKDGQSLPGGWKLLSHHISNSHHPITSKEVWLRPDTGIRFTTGSVRPIRSEIRHWLEQYGVPDAPDLALHPITIGFTIRLKLQNNKQATLKLNPWLRLARDQQIAASGDIEILPELGTSDSPKQPPSTVAPMRLNIQPAKSLNSIRYIRINRADTEVNIRIGEKIELLAYEHEAKTLGDAILSRTMNGLKKFIVLRLEFE